MVSVAVNVAFPAIVELTLKVTTPAMVTAVRGEILSVPPRFELKSVVIPDDITIELELVKPEAPGLAVIDGQTRWDIEPEEKVWVRKAEGVTRFIRLYDNYWDRINTRLVPRTL